MNSRTGKSEHEKKARAGDQPKLSKKILKRDPETIHVQYPARVGYHGTDDEKDLNPEE